MSIRVNGPSGPRASASTRKTEKTKSASGGFASALRGQEEVDEAPAPSSMEATASVSAVDALLAVQQVDDATSGKSKKQRAVNWAENLLDRLDEIRMSLLSGSVPPEKLHAIAREVATRKGNTNDPRLESILDEIEIRAAVEIAKHGRARR